jgi:hypothetical protein
LQGLNVAQLAEGAVGRDTLGQLQHHVFYLCLNQRNTIGAEEVLVNEQRVHPVLQHEMGVLVKQFLAPAKGHPEHLDV